MNPLKYTGKKLLKAARIKREGLPDEVIQPYLVHEELSKAVNLAILLKRPLLLMGEPGCGKTRLAQAVAYELYHQEEEDRITRDYREWYFEWNIKSTEKAKDGLYYFDAIERLRDAQAALKLKEAEEYVHHRAMGLALQKSVASNQRAVLLIDEIDKADLDFPNDLLNELDKSEYTIPETGKTYVSPAKPIVFITSNNEKELPDAFLRRCLYYYIPPMKEGLLKRIIHSRFYSDGVPTADADLVEKAVKQFIEIRNRLEKEKLTVGKNVSTGELMDWFEALKFYHHLAKANGHPDPTTQALIEELEKLGKGARDIPYAQVLLKNWNSLVAFERM